FGWRKCEGHVACHSNGELPRVFSTLEWRATLFAGIHWKIMMPVSIGTFLLPKFLQDERTSQLQMLAEYVHGVLESMSGRV
ncbi:MAG: hypothetical protein ACI9DF_004707, partial [Verrucomicrobiales bacterium]